MKLLMTLFLFTSFNAFSETSINNYSCEGQKLTKTGLLKGNGDSLIVLTSSGTVRVIDKADSSVVELAYEGTDRSGGSEVYTTSSTRSGFGLAIHKSNIDIRLGEQVYLYLFNFKNGQVQSSFTLDCKVTSSSRL